LRFDPDLFSNYKIAILFDCLVLRFGRLSPYEEDRVLDFSGGESVASAMSVFQGIRSPPPNRRFTIPFHFPHNVISFLNATSIGTQSFPLLSTIYPILRLFI
jgi:hypothetical protein